MNSISPITHEGYKLLHDGEVALSQVEHNGIKVDVKYLDRKIEETSKQITDLSNKLKLSKVYRDWRRRFGGKTNLGSRAQLGTVLFDVLKYPCKEFTKGKRPKVDEHILEDIDLPFVRSYLKVEKLKKARTTYLIGIRREVAPDGFLHPSFNLNLVRTFRSSCESPNFQNFPVRNPEVAKLVRNAIIPRGPDYQIGESDFGGIEVRVACCYHKDPVMLTYIRDPSKDLHRDMAAQCYKLKKGQVTKQIRYCGKNKFVFPQFYGDFYINCAKSLWEAIDKMKLETVDGIPLKKHLKSKGITELGECDSEEQAEPGTFEYHLQQVEQDFWKKRFKVYDAWKQKWWLAYLKKGYFDTYTGFRLAGVYRRNEAINYPIQGDAFHCLLWCLIQIQKLLRKYKMKTLIIGQIHDSIVSDIYIKELKDYLEICNQVMTVDLLKHWPFIIVPIEVESEISPPGKTWYEKTKVDWRSL